MRAPRATDHQPTEAERKEHPEGWWPEDERADDPDRDGETGNEYGEEPIALRESQSADQREAAAGEREIRIRRPYEQRHVCDQEEQEPDEERDQPEIAQRLGAPRLTQRSDRRVHEPAAGWDGRRPSIPNEPRSPETRHGDTGHTGEAHEQ